MIRLRLIAVLSLTFWFLTPYGARPVSAADLPIQPHEIQVISFNIQFLGNSKTRRNQDLASLLAPYDLVFIQELVAPPYPGTFPDGSPFKPDREAKAFFEAMKAQGFSYVLSEEDTGISETNHKDSSATEWFVAFYKPGVVRPDEQLPHGFLAADRSHNPDYDRVPYAFPFRAGNVDLVFISVHLSPKPSDHERRSHELATITKWITTRPGSERDYVILGDMNMQNCNEMNSDLPSNYASLNAECLPTNTKVDSPKPYDHVMYNTEFSAQEIDRDKGLTVIDLAKEMRQRWPSDLGPFPDEPEHHDAFRRLFSDHNPILFDVRVDGPDDD